MQSSHWCNTDQRSNAGHTERAKSLSQHQTNPGACWNTKLSWGQITTDMAISMARSIQLYNNYRIIEALALCYCWYNAGKIQKKRTACRYIYWTTYGFFPSSVLRWVSRDSRRLSGACWIIKRRWYNRNVCLLLTHYKSLVWSERPDNTDDTPQ